LSQKKYDKKLCVVLELVPQAKKISSLAHKEGSWHLLGVLFKISDEYPNMPFLYDSPSLLPPPPGASIC